jgi:cobalt-zinc-cadmium resistance protein CzcA
MKASQLEIATQVKQVYWELSYLHSKLKLLTYQDSLFSGFLRAAQLRANIGETNKLEMITARSQSMEVKNQLQQLKTEILIHNQQLQFLLNTNNAIAIADTVLHRSDSLTIAENAALNENPSLHSVQQQIEILRIEKKLEYSKIMPDITVGYFSQTMQGVQEINGVPRTFSTGDRFNGVQAGISIPLWFVPHTSKVKTARLKEIEAQTNAEYYSQSLKGNYNTLLSEYQKYKNSIYYYENQAIPEVDIIINQATLSYKAGAIDYLEYISNVSRALSVKQNYLEALNSYNQTIVSIDFLTGKIF